MSMTTLGRPAPQSGGRLSLRAVYEACGFEPHAAQVPILNSGARFKVVAAGRRFGKSEIGGHEHVPDALLSRSWASTLRDEGKRWENWIVGPEYSDAEKEFRKLYNALRRLEVPFDKPGTYNNPHTGDMQISLWEGAFLVIAHSAKYPDNLVGEGLHRLTLSEAAKIKQRVWDKHLRPTLADFDGECTMVSTPEGKNWFYKRWQAGQDPLDHEWASWRRPAWLNPYVYKTPTTRAGVKALQKLKLLGQPITEEVARLHTVDWEIASVLKDQTEQSFNQEIAADFNEYVGAVFKDWDEELHVRDLSFNPGWKTYAAVDYGFTNPTVWLLIQVGPFGEVHVLDEYYERERTIPEAAKEIEARGLKPSSLIGFFPDPASPGSTKDLSDRLRVRAFKSGTGGTINHRLTLIRDALKPRPDHLPVTHPDVRPRMLVDRRNCPNTIREMAAYRYPRTADEAAQYGKDAPENPLKKDDHTPEALGRFFGGLEHMNSHIGRSTVVRGSTMRRRPRG